MSAPAWMPLYVADYLADTGHLSRDEHGAYMLLIMHYWQHGGLPDSDEKLARITQSANVDDWLSIRSAMVDLFLPGWRHKRIDEEISKTNSLLEKRAKAGKIGGLASASKRQANVEQTSTPLPLPSSKKEKKKESFSGFPKNQEKQDPHAVTWVQDHEPLWPVLVARHQQERGNPVNAVGSRYDTGTGHYFPYDWVVEAFNASGSGAAGSHSGAPQAITRGVARNG